MSAAETSLKDVPTDVLRGLRADWEADLGCIGTGRRHRAEEMIRWIDRELNGREAIKKEEP